MDTCWDLNFKCGVMDEKLFKMPDADDENIFATDDSHGITTCVLPIGVS